MSGYTKNKLSLAVVAAQMAMVSVGTVSVSALGQDNAGNQESQLEEVVVEGFRSSLIKAIDAKRDAVNARESIMAEDIGKFPDLNLAESIQRVPGVAISREGGEGRQITLRGLGPEFTRTTLNGMEVPASTNGLDSSGGLNSGRSFDFNVFASELFNRIDIQKSTRAFIEEGGIAGTVDLYTPKPFDKPGLQSGVSVQMGYNDLTEENDPRISGFVSNTFADDTIGVLLSVSKTERTVRQEGFGTVRWDVAESSGGWADTSNTEVNGNLAPGETLDTVYAPRLPRTDYFGNEQDRLGVTGSFQFRPSDRAEITFDYVHSKFENERESHNLMAQFRSQFNDITPLEVTLDPTGKYIVAGSFDDVNLRNESRQTISETEFNQYALKGDFELTDTITLSAMYGQAESVFRSEEFRYNINVDNALVTPFSFDLTGNSDVASMTYGVNLLDSSLYEFSGPTIRANDVDRENETLRFDLNINLSDLSEIRTGLIYNDRTVDSAAFDAIRGANPTVADGLIRPLGVSDFGSGLDAPGGFPTNWMVSDFGRTTAAYDLQGWRLRQTDGNTWSVSEETLGAYVDYEAQYELFAKPLRVNAGVRYVSTEVTAKAFTAVDDGAVLPLTADNDYDHLLPSLNLALDLTEDVIGRLSLSRTLTRPSLSSLAPNFSIDVNNGEVSGGNPDLEPTEADAIDLGIEWYFAEGEGLLGATVFYKDIEGFIARFTEARLLDPEHREIVEADSRCQGENNACPSVDQLWEYSTPLNNQGATLKGVELAYQQPFTFLSGPLSNFGVVLNYTYVDSESTYGEGEDRVTSRLIGLSKNSWNATLYYEVDNWGARVSVNDRDDYVTGVPGSNNNLTEATSGSTHVDFSGFYDINDFLTVTFEAVNLTDEEERLFVDGDGSLDLVREYNHTGRQLFLGLRANF